MPLSIVTVPWEFIVCVCVSRGDSTLHIITAIGENSIQLDSGLEAEHWGGFREIEGYRSAIQS